jgi:hypothetical protein
MNQSTPTDHITPEQIDFVLSDIATVAQQINRMACALISGGCDVLDNETLLIAIESMAQRIGWAADMAMARSEHSIGPCIGSAENWMMPPAFHRSERGES